MWFAKVSAVLAFGALATALPNTRRQQSIVWQSCPELNENITISNGIEGVPLDCAALSVPLDYTDSSSPPLELALFKVNATQAPVLGSVLINFGGPGGTAAENLPIWATQMAANIGPQWDLVSWDPRGTGKTIPFDCGDLEASASASPNKRKRQATGLVSGNLTEYFLNGGWETAGLTADACYATMNETGQYISTSFTARDMISIVDALGEDGLLRYYGWSYGTALGSYVAAMFPERVESIVLDANVNPLDYQTGTYGAFLQDADKDFDAFLQECINNAADCALAQYTNATNTADLYNAINLLFEPLATTAAINETTWTTYSGVQQLIFGQLYYPHTWPSLAETITSLLNGTYTAPETPDTIGTYNLGYPWSGVGIRASDATFRTNDSSEYLPVVQAAEQVTSFDTGYPTLWTSARWRINAKEQYTGNFTVKTAKPILLVNGEFDPVTPLANAYNASQGWAGSSVLTHSGYGHGSVVDPSSCVMRHVQAYFLNGTLPQNGTHCEPDMGPWEYARAQANASESGNTTQEPFTGGAGQGGVPLGGLVFGAVLTVLCAAML